MKRLIVLLILIFSTIPSVQAQTVAEISENSLVTRFPDGVVMTVTPHTLTEPGWVTVQVTEALVYAKTSPVASKLVSSELNFKDSFKTQTVDSKTLKIWVDVPWNGPLSSGKYDIEVNYDGKLYTIDPWWNITYWSSQKLSFDTLTTGITANLVDFPVMVRLNSSRISWDELQSDGDDLRFIDADNSTVLSYEIEKFSYNDEAIIWVKVPQIDANSTTDHIWMYYNNPDASSGENASGVWDSSFVMVQHMNDETTSTILDSTSNNVDGNKKGINEPIETNLGKIGNAQSFDGTDDYSTMGNTPFLNFESIDPFSLEGWLKPNNTGTNRVIISKQDSASPAKGWRLLLSSANKISIALYYTNAPSNYIETSTNAVFSDTSTWTHFLVTYNGSSLKEGLEIYINGDLAETTDSATTLTDDISNSYPANIGSRNNGALVFNGVLDEIRVYDQVMSLIWAKGVYYAEIDSLISYNDPWAGLWLTIYDGEGAVIPSSTVVIKDATSTIVTGTARSDGTYHYQLDDGDYTATVSKTGYDDNILTFTVNGEYKYASLVLNKTPTNAGALIIFGLLFALVVAKFVGAK